MLTGYWNWIVDVANRTVSAAVLLGLPDDLAEQMELAEEARNGNIDVKRVYQPVLKLDLFIQYFQLRDLVILFILKVITLVVSAMLSLFVEPTPTVFLGGLVSLYFTLYGIRKKYFSASSLMFFGTIGTLVAEFVNLPSIEPGIPPVYLFMVKLSIIPMASYHSMKPWQAHISTIGCLAFYAYAFYISVGKTYVFDSEDMRSLFLYGLAVQTYPVIALKMFASEMGIFHSLLEKFLVVAENRSKEKTNFISRMSHELRTPLHGLLSSVSLLRRTEITHEQGTFLSTVESCGEVVLDVIVKILDINKIESGDFQLTLNDFSLFGMVKALAESVSSLIEAKALDFSVYFHPHPEGYDVRGDKAHLREILMNLLGNAIKFTDHGHVTIKVRRQDTAWKQTASYHIEVEDSGHGISEQGLSKIFLPFSQLHNSRNKKTEGSGLGLSISRRLCQALGGKIDVRSSEGSGSTFWMEIPMVPLPAGTIYPPLDCLPGDAESLSRVARYFGDSDDLRPPASLPIVVGTNYSGQPLGILTSTMAAWGVQVEALSTPQRLELFLNANHHLLIINDDAPYIPQLIAHAQSLPSSMTRPPLRVSVFSKLSAFSTFVQLAPRVPAPSRMVVLLNPLEPLKLYRILLFFLGGDACLGEGLRDDRTATAPNEPPKIVPLLPPSSTEISAASPVDTPDVIDVLVVEDNPVNQLILRKILERTQVRFRVTASGEDGLQIWRSSLNSIPLILMDVEVEGCLTGLEVTSRIRELERDRDQARCEAGFAPLKPSFIAIMTGRAMESDRLEALSCGCDEFLTKPVNLSMIQKVIESNLH